MSAFVRSIRSVFSFYAFIVRRARRTRVFVLVSFLPAVVALVIRISAWLSPGASVDGPAVFSNIVLTFNLQFLILVLALFYGTSIAAEELEGKTLTYLTTRPVPKAAIILGKYAAYAAFLIGVVAAGVTAAFVILHADRLGDGSSWLVLVRSAAVLCLGLLTYLAFFTLAGVLLKKSVLFGLMFSFGWENIVPYFPGATQRLTIMHYLKSLLPAVSTGGEGSFAFLMFKLEPSAPAAAIATLAVVTAAALILACWAFTRKEYLFEE
jgi:ABC-type transport system involved in multi-copper enzyme maturation permease subunit